MSRAVLITMTLSMLAPGCKGKKVESSAPPTESVSEAQTARKARSEARLRREGISILESLPCIEDAKEAKSRSQEEVIGRAFSLAVVAVKGEGLEQAKVWKFRDELGVRDLLSPKEQAFVALEAPDQKTRAQFAWRYEAAHVTHWALGRVSNLAPPKDIVDAAKVIALVKDPADYRKQAKLRSIDELLDEADLIYRYDWACVDARVRKAPPPKGIDCEIVVERHQALNWLIGYQGQAWDDVSTDT